MSFDFKVVRSWEDEEFEKTLCKLSCNGWEVISIQLILIPDHPNSVRATPGPRVSRQHVAYLKRHMNYEFNKRMENDLRDIILAGPRPQDLR